MIKAAAGRPVLFFDGVCNLCNRWVQFMIRHDRKKQFLFASLQSENGQLMQQHLLQQAGKMPDSVVLLYRDKYYIKSDAAIRAAALLGGVYKLLLIGLIVPRFLRNIVYDRVAQNRYKWYGKTEGCMIPTPELKERFH